MKLHRELNITQKSTWYLLHRLQKAYETGCFNFQGPIEVDEAYFGGKEANKHERKKLKAGRETVGKTAVEGMKDRETNQIKAKVASVQRQRRCRDLCERTQTTARPYTRMIILLTPAYRSTIL